jgi:lycopene cyclase domain-containing protein
MLETKYLYLLINVFIIIVPLARSFEPRIAYYKSFKALFLAMSLVSGFFIIWDIIFTHIGVWGFNPKYLCGIGLFGLPLGEWLFFVTVPYSCLFIYRTLNYFIKRDVLAKHTKTISNFLMGFSFALAAIYYDRWYTVTTFILLGAFVSYLQYRANPPWLGRIYLAYAVCLLPFFMVNGILTGTGIAEEVVRYNPEEIIGKRLATIPFEDAFYGLLLVLGTTYFYELFGGSKSNQNVD